MQVSYDGIIFDIILLKNWLKEAVYTEDKTTFLYWHHVIEVEVTLNDDATNYENFPIIVKGQAQNPAVLRNKQLLLQAQIKAAWIERNKNIQIRQAQRDFLNAPNPRSDLGFLDPDNLESIPVPGGANVSGPADIARNRIQRAINNAGDKLDALDAATAAALEDPFNLTVKDLKHNTTPQGNRKKHTVPSTDVELRYRLSRPRRQLAVWLFTGEKTKPEYLLVSPDPSTVTLDADGNPDTGTIDALTGPLCTILNTTAIHGQQTAVMSLKFETWEGPKIDKRDNKFAQPTFGDPRLEEIEKQNLIDGIFIPTPPILSHRWEMSYGFNPQNYLRIRVIEGEVIFRSDVLKLRGISADQLRPQFMNHAVPANFIRRPVEDLVRLSSNGVGIKYRVVDDEQMTNFPAGSEWGLVNIEMSSSLVYKSSPTSDIIFDLGRMGIPGGEAPKDFNRRFGFKEQEKKSG